jgi:hypothetical protein
MAICRVYRFDKDGHVAGPPHVVDRASDPDAVADARQFVDGLAVEV